MKTFLLLSTLLLFVACKKPDKEVTYSAVGVAASVAYVNADGHWDRASLYQHDTTPAQWSYTFSEDHFDKAKLEITQEFGATAPAFGILTVDGVVVARGTVEHYRDKILINEP